MTMQSLTESFIYQVGETQEERLTKKRKFAPQFAFTWLEDNIKAITHKANHLKSLYDNRESHAAVLRAIYPLFINHELRGSSEAEAETEKLFKLQEVEFNEENYSTVVSAVLDYVAGLSDKDLSVLRVISGSDPKWPK